jgi:hypothetical protein
MSRRHAVSRLVLLAIIAALAASVVGTTAVQGRSPGWQPAHRLQDGPQPLDGGRRADRHVNVAKLPAASGASRMFVPSGKRPATDRVAAPTGVNVAPAPALATTNTDPAITEATSFDGLAQIDRPATLGEPPDPFVAVGPDHVMQAVNTTFRMSTRSGAEVATVDLVDFFGISSIPDYDAFVFDPRVIFDSLHGRWIATEASFDCYPVTGGGSVGTGYIDIAVSATADPTGNWVVRSLFFDDEIADYPGLGTSTDKVALSSNQFALVPGGSSLGCSDGGLLGSYVELMAWSQLVGTGSVNVVYHPVVGAEAFARRPALQTPATSATVYVISERSNDNVLYQFYTGNPVTGVSVGEVDLTATSVAAGFALPDPPQQPGAPGTIVDAVDARTTDAVWKDNKLAFVSTRPCDPTGGPVGESRDCVRVTELATNNQASPTRIQDFLVADTGFDSYMGGVGYALNDDMHVVWTQSNSTAPNYPSNWSAYQSSTAANKTLSEKKRLSDGTGTYPGTRWGDYVGVAQDPQVVNAVWEANQFSAGADGWATEVSQLQTGGSSYVPITPVRVLDSRPAFQIGLSGVFQTSVPRTWNVAGFKVNNVEVIPAVAVAVTGNFVVVNQTGAGYAAVGPTPNANPPTSSLNFPLGDIRANNVTVPLSAAGKLSAVYKAAAGKTTHLIFDVTGYFLAGSAEATYATITPTRVLDSRVAYGIGLTGRFNANTPRTLSVAGDNGIPADAVAVTANLAVVNQTRAGYVAITPDPNPNPPTATMNFPLGDVRANGLTARLNIEGDLSLVYKATSGTTDLILDITGYYVDAPDGMLFFPLAPGRIMDTRPGVALSRLSGMFTSSTPRTFSANGHFGIPAGAGAITGNLSIVGQTVAGYAVITPDPDPNPPTATINFPVGDVRGNGVTVPLNAMFDLSFVYKAKPGSKTHMILDVTGYFR